MSVTSVLKAAASANGLILATDPDRLRGSVEYRNALRVRYDHRARLEEKKAKALNGGNLFPGANIQRARVDSKGNAASAEDLARSDAMMSEWVDAYAAMDPSARMDSLVPMASQGLTYFYSGVMEYAHPALPAWSEIYLKKDRQVDPASENYTWYEMDMVGFARAGSTYASNEIPMVVGPVAQANFGNIMPFLVGFEMDVMEQRRENFAKSNGKPDFKIYQSKLKTAQKVLAEAINYLWMYGDSETGIDGLLNHPAIGTLTIVGPWSGKTPLQIQDDFTQIINIIPNTTLGDLGDLSKIKVFLPPTQYDKLAQPITAAGNASVLSYVKETWGLRDDQIVKRHDLAAANSQLWQGGAQGLQRDRALVIYDQGDDMRDPSFILSQDIEILGPPKLNGVSETMFLHARAGGVKVPDARGIKWIEGI